MADPDPEEEHLIFFSYLELIVINRALGAAKRRDNPERISEYLLPDLLTAREKVEEKMKEIDSDY